MSEAPNPHDATLNRNAKEQDPKLETDSEAYFCVKCGKTNSDLKEEGEGKKLLRCTKCGTRYCSAACQKQDWKDHKTKCNQLLVDRALSSTSVNLGEKGKKGRRTNGEMYSDLAKWANAHNGDTLTVTAWNALSLLKEPSNRLLKMLVLLLRRRQSETTNPRAFYELLDGDVLGIDEIRSKFMEMNTIDPLEILKLAEEDSRRDGHLGACLVIGMEVLEGDNRPLRKVYEQTSIMTLQPLRIFQVHRDSMSKLPPLMFKKDIWFACLKNALAGGDYTFGKAGKKNK